MEDRAIPFRLPHAAAARLSLSFLSLAGFGILLEALVLRRSMFDAKTFAIVVCGFLLLTGALYVVLRTRSWVSVTHQGLRGRFLWFFWRTVPWASISGAFAKPSWFIRGYQIGRSDEMGIPLPFAAVFVPAAIFQAPEFVKAIEQLSSLLRLAHRFLGSGSMQSNSSLGRDTPQQAAASRRVWRARQLQR